MTEGTLAAWAVKAGDSVKAGDVLLEINGVRITKTADLVKATAVPARIWRVTLQRGGRTMTAMLPG